VNSDQRPRASFTTMACVFVLLAVLSGFAFIPHAAMGACSPNRIAAPILAQDEDAGDENEVPPAEIDKYIEVYKATQRDHSLTVEQAAAQQGLTLEAFRQLENKIEQDDSAREHVRDALQAAATKSPSPTPTARRSPGHPSP
jgi:hypothetical protein